MTGLTDEGMKQNAFSCIHVFSPFLLEEFYRFFLMACLIDTHYLLCYRRHSFHLYLVTSRQKCAAFRFCE